MFQKILTFGGTHRLYAFILMVVLSGVAYLGMPWAAIGLPALDVEFGQSKLRMDSAYDSLLDKTDPSYAIYQESVATFGSDYITLVYVRDEDLFTPEKLLELQEFTYEIEKLDFVERVKSLFTITNVRDVDGDLDTSALMSTAPETLEEALQIRERANENPFVPGNFLSKDNKGTVITVILEPRWGDAELPRLALNSIEDLIEPIRGKFDYVTQIGPPKVQVGTQDGIMGDTFVLTPLAAGVLIVFNFVLMRTLTASFLPFVTASLSIVWTLGFMGLAGVPMNMLSAALPALLIAVGSTEDTHMIAAYLRGIDQNNKPNIRVMAIRFMMKKVGLATMLTAGTTTLGFASSMFANMQVLRDFGAASAIGMITNLIVTVLFVPFALRTFGPQKTGLVKEEKDLKGIFQFVYNSSKNLADKYPKQVLILTGIVISISLASAYTLRPSNNPISFLKEDNPIVLLTQRMHEEVSGIQVFYIVLDGKEDAAFKQPENLRILANIQKYLDESGYFDKTISLADHIRLVNREMNNDSKGQFVVPDDPDLIEQYLLFFQWADINNFVNHDFSKANVTVRHNILDSAEMLDVQVELEAALDKIVGDSITYDMVSQTLLIDKAADNLVMNQLWSFLLVIVVIFALISLIFTSVTLGALSLIPNVTPAVMTFAVMTVFDIPLNAGTVLVAVVALAVAVDDTIHLVTSYSERSKTLRDPIKAANAAVNSQVIPVTATSVSLSITFAVLLFSNFGVLADFGILCMTAFITAMLMDLYVTPVFMRQIRLVGLWDIVALDIGTDVMEKCTLFKNMTKFQIRKVILLSHMKEYKKGEDFIVQGQQDNAMYVLLSGSATVLHQGDNQQEIVLAQIQAGDVVGEIGFTGEIERTASVRANEPVKLISINAEETARSLRFYPKIASKLYQNISRVLGKRMLENMDTISGLTSGK